MNRLKKWLIKYNCLKIMTLHIYLLSQKNYIG
jgi:hypothetical protein